MSVNKAIILGRLTKNPEQHGELVTFSLATNESWTDKNGEKQERVEFHNIKAFGKTGELVMNYLEKGRQIYIEGKISTENYTDSNGVKKYSTSIVMNNMQFLGDATKENKDVDYKKNRNNKASW